MKGEHIVAMAAQRQVYQAKEMARGTAEPQATAAKTETVRPILMARKTSQIDRVLDVFAVPEWQFGFSAEAQERVRLLYNMAVENTEIRMRGNGHIGFACVYRVCKELDYPVMASDIVEHAARFGLTLKADYIIAIQLLVVRKLNLERRLTNPKIFVRRFVGALHLEEEDDEREIESRANGFISELEEKRSLDIGVPAGIARSAIFLSFLDANIPTSLKGLSRAVGSTPAVIIKTAIDIEGRIGANLISRFRTIRP